MPKLQMIKRSNGSLVFSVNIPLETIEELGWKKGDEISAEIKKVRDSNIIVLEKQEGGKKMVARYEVFKVGDKWKFLLRAHNGKLIAMSTGEYASKRSAVNGIETMRDSACDAVILYLNN